MRASIASAIGAIGADRWDALAGRDDPFLSHAFLSALEDSGSVGPDTGWQAAPVVVEAADGTLKAAAPSYIKAHSQGEYVFDHGWAEAWHRAGGAYYPKVQIAVPFTPVPGRRLLAHEAGDMPVLLAAIEGLVAQNDLSSAHATFVDPAQLDLFRAAGWLIRRDVQFHWFNRGFAAFDDFLDALSSRKRKAIRRERRIANDAVKVRILNGAEIRTDDWDTLWTCYQDTGARKWGRPYLTRDAFALIGERLADRVLLLIADDRTSGRPIAAALNFIGTDALYGRYWGALADVDCLHFELCYYRAIDFAIARGLSRVEAGAQGQHKLARGYEPVPTWSAHHIPHAGFRAAISEFLTREAEAVAADGEWLAGLTPFRKDG